MNASTVTLTATGGSSISLVGNMGNSQGATVNTLALNTSSGNGTINLNVSVGVAGLWDALSGFSANAGTGAINWTGTLAAGNNQVTPVTLTGGINFSSNFVCYLALPMTLNPRGRARSAACSAGPCR